MITLCVCLCVYLCICVSVCVSVCVCPCVSLCVWVLVPSFFFLAYLKSLLKSSDSQNSALGSLAFKHSLSFLPPKTRQSPWIGTVSHNKSTHARVLLVLFPLQRLLITEDLYCQVWDSCANCPEWYLTGTQKDLIYPDTHCRDWGYGNIQELFFTFYYKTTFL